MFQRDGSWPKFRLPAERQDTTELLLVIQLARYASANAKTRVHFGCPQIDVTWHIAAAGTREYASDN